LIKDNPSFSIPIVDITKLPGAYSGFLRSGNYLFYYPEKID